MKLRTVHVTNTLLAGLAAFELVPFLLRLRDPDFSEQYREPLIVIVVVLALGAAFFLRTQRRTRHLLSRQEQLRQERRALNTHAMVSLTDTNARLTSVNEKLLEATGYAEEELLGQHVSILYFEDDIPKMRSLKATIDAGRAWQGESRLRRKDGSALWTGLTIIRGVNDAGQHCGSISVRTDITGVKEAQAQQAIVQALDHLSEEIYLVDSRTGGFTYVNKAAARRTGWRDGAHAGRTFEAVDPQLSTGAFAEALDLVTSGAKPMIALQAISGGHPYEITVSRMQRDTDDNEVMVVMRDITAQVEGERIRNEFISTVSHELRTPLTSIKGSVGLILSGAAGEVPDRARGMIEIAQRNSERLLNIINDLLDIEKIAAGKMDFDMAQADLSRLIDEAIEVNQPFASRFDVRVERQGRDTAEAWFDFNRSLQVMTNLLSNAAKFSPPGGKICVRLDESSLGYRISVQDFGRGIPQDALPTIFEKFVQVAEAQSDAVRSTGLGLAITKAIVDQQGGRITAESVEGEGTTFHIDFLDHAPGGAVSELPALAEAS